MIDQTQRSNRSTSSSLSAPFTPHITLEIPTINYGNFLSPIHEVPTPLPSPSHTPIPSLRRQRNLCLDGPNPNRPKDESSSDESRQSSSSMPSINWESDNTVNLMPVAMPKSIATSIPLSLPLMIPPIVTINVDGELTNISRSPTRTNKPPPLQIVNSNFARFEVATAVAPAAATASAAASAPPLVPVVCVFEPSPNNDSQLLQSSDSHPGVALNYHAKKSALNWQSVSIGSPPIRKTSDYQVAQHVANSDSTVICTAAVTDESSFRRGFKESFQDKSYSLDLPMPPPMITITANFSEVDSDTDAGLLGKYHFPIQALCGAAEINFPCYSFAHFKSKTLYSFIS